MMRTLTGTCACLALLLPLLPAPARAQAASAPAAPAAAAPAPAPAPAPATTAAPDAARTAPSSRTSRRHSHAHHHRHHEAIAAAASNPVVLTQQPGTALDQAARQLGAEDLSGAAARHETPIVLIGSAPLSTSPHGEAALFVQLQSASLCGSAGCSTSVYLRRDGRWAKVLDSVSGPIKVLSSQSGGMHDLMVGDKDRWTWFGSAYHDTLPAAPIGNLKKSVEQHQAQERAHGG